MALTSRRLHREEEEESVFVSMTDLMISILFIVMIVMAFFAKTAKEDIPRIEVLQKEVERLEKENDRLWQDVLRLEKFEKEAHDLALQVEALRRDNRVLRRDLAELQVDYENLTKDNEKLQKEKAALEKLVEKLRKELLRLQVEVDRLLKLQAPDALAIALSGISEDRRQLLDRLQKRLEAANIRVIVDEVSGVVRFGEDSVRFESGEHIASAGSQDNMRKIAEILSEELVCFTLGPNSTISSDCNPNSSVIEAVQIEGHTDLDGSVPDNFVLSTQRATSTYDVMVRHRPVLERFLNANYLINDEVEAPGPGPQVLSVSGYGETRPVAFGGDAQSKRANRRIDVRFIMTTPKNVEEVEKLKQAVRRALEQQEGTQ